MLGNVITPKRVVLALVGVQVADALYNVMPSKWIEADLEHLRVPPRARYLFGSVKGASAIGLLIGLRRPAFGRLTARSLIVYFALAIGAHVRIRDRPARYAPALTMLGWSALALRCFPRSSVRPAA